MVLPEIIIGKDIEFVVVRVQIKLIIIFLVDIPEDESENFYIDINQSNQNGYTPLHLAVMYGYLLIVKALLRCTISSWEVMLAFHGFHIFLLETNSLLPKI